MKKKLNLVRKSEFLVLAKNTWSETESKIFSILVQSLEKQVIKYIQVQKDIKTASENLLELRIKRDNENNKMLLVEIVEELIKEEIKISKMEEKLLKTIEFKEQSITIGELEKILRTSINTTRVREVCRDLKEKCYEIVNELELIVNKKTIYDYVSLFSQITYKKDDKEISFTFDNQLKKHILVFATQFVSYDIANIIRFKSKYSISFYERFKLQTQFKKESLITETIELAELKEILNLGNKYKRTNDFKKKVLDVVKNDIQKFSDVYMNYEYVKKGKRIYAVKFSFTKQDKIEVQQSFFSDDELETAYDKFIGLEYKNNNGDLVVIKQIIEVLKDTDYIKAIVFNEFAQANQEAKISKKALNKKG